ncbi:MAG: CBS domain-containing protein [Myxococcales bacterium]|nr:CBS domain-containing protein [Myxococcales bacterium]
MVTRRGRARPRRAPHESPAKSAAEPEPSGKLPVRRAVVRERGGVEATTLSVSCPVRTQCVSLSVCAACPRSVHLPDAPGGDDAAVECHHKPPLGRAEAERATRDMELGEATVRVTVGAISPRTVTMLRDDATAADAQAVTREVWPCAVPVVTGDGALVGMVSRAHLDGADAHAVVRDVMQRDVEPLGEEQPIIVAVVRLAGGESTLPVIAPDGHVVGVLTSRDVMRWMATSLGYET